MIDIQCPMCPEVTEVPIIRETYNYWLQNQCRLPLIQQHFPELTADEREAIQTGICYRCWASLWPEEVES